MRIARKTRKNNSIYIKNFNFFSHKHFEAKMFRAYPCKDEMLEILRNAGAKINGNTTAENKD